MYGSRRIVHLRSGYGGFFLRGRRIYRQKKDRPFCRVERDRTPFCGDTQREAGDPPALPELFKGQTFEHPAAKVTEHDTTPPKPHNEASLLSAMERAGNEETDPDAERRGLERPPPAPLSLKNW